jgi:hypothetical protein
VVNKSGTQIIQQNGYIVTYDTDQGQSPRVIAHHTGTASGNKVTTTSDYSETGYSTHEIHELTLTGANTLTFNGTWLWSSPKNCGPGKTTGTGTRR